MEIINLHLVIKKYSFIQRKTLSLKKTPNSSVVMVNQSKIPKKEILVLNKRHIIILDLKLIQV